MFCIDQTASTNDVVRRWARDGRPRGRRGTGPAFKRGDGAARGRSWFSAPGAGMFLSVLLRPSARGAAGGAAYHSRGGLALAQVLRADYGVEAGLEMAQRRAWGRGASWPALLCEASFSGVAME